MEQEMNNYPPEQSAELQQPFAPMPHEYAPIPTPLDTPKKKKNVFKTILSVFVIIVLVANAAFMGYLCVREFVPSKVGAEKIQPYFDAFKSLQVYAKACAEDSVEVDGDSLRLVANNDGYSSNLRIKGEVENTSNEKLVAISIIFNCLDEDGDIVGTCTASIGELDADDTEEFDVYCYLEDVDSIEVKNVYAFYYDDLIAED